VESPIPHYIPNPTPVIVGDRVIFGGFDGTVRALSTRSGSVLWQRDLGAWISTLVAAIGDDLYVGDFIWVSPRLCRGTPRV